MPLIKFSYTEGAIAPGALEGVVSGLVDVLLTHHVAAKAATQLERVTNVMVREYPRDRFFVGRRPTTRHRYDIELLVPEMSVEGDRRDAIVREMAELLLAQEGTPWSEEDARRVWMVIRDVPEGRWGVGGVIVTAKTILRVLLQQRSQERRDRREARVAGGGKEEAA
jgi:phenylpyruvate tautomerase PptA (4-oxalocrotonate tautomerase family)